MKFCPKCRSKLIVPDFCVECGADLSEYLKNETESTSGGLGSIDFSAFESEAQKQLAEQERLADFEIEDGVLKKYVGNGGKVVVPKEVTVIGPKAFAHDWSVTDKITEVIFEGNVTEIRDEAFDGCYNLKSMVLPKSLKKIGKEAFLALGVSSLELPRGGVVIGEGAFYRSHLTSITVPGDVIFEEPGWFGGSGAFEASTSLQYVTIENGLKWLHNGMFEGCTSLRSITIPDSVVGMGDNAFYECKGLMSIQLPCNITAIPRRAFAYCSSLSRIEIPRGVTKIEISAFDSCTNLTSVTLPEGLTHIGEFAFANCKALTSVTIPQSVTKIDDLAFQGCDNLRTVKIPAHLTPPYFIGSNFSVIRY